MKKSFRKKIKQALDNSSLRNALENLGATYPQARAKAYEGVDFEALRSEVEQVKENAIANIESLADTFEEKVRGNGGVFHRAADGREVIEIIKAIAGKRSTAGVGESSKKVGFSPPTSEERRVITCVKSKSMTSEEIELNEGLEDMMAVVETDLGEWIIQQVAEKPSHIVMPAIHLTKEKCAEIFSKAVGYKVEPDIPRMVNLARRILRDHFLKADIGISGCNIAAAQTGTMVIFTNEGNARLTSTLPPVHIVLLGYEKLVPKFKDIAATVNVLPKSATGQVITSYITMISGPAETLESGFSQTSSSEEPENKQKFFGGLRGAIFQKSPPHRRRQIKKKELHVILLDNGRLKMLKDPVFKAIGRCIRCASCLNVCPVYQLLSGQVYGHIYSGGIGALLTSFLNSPKEAKQVEGLCLNCGKCKEVCPAKIDIPGLTVKLRTRLSREFPPPFLQRFITGKVVPAAKVFHTAMRTAALGSRLVSSPGQDGNTYIKKLPFGLKKLTHWRPLPAFAKKSFREEAASLSSIDPGKKQTLNKSFLGGPGGRFFKKAPLVAEGIKGRIAFFAGCMIDYVYPEIGEAVVRVLNSRGYEVVFPEQSCCGAPAFYSGLSEAAARSARLNLESFAAEKWDYIVTACPTCTIILKKHWQELLAGEPALAEPLEKVAAKTFDFVKLLYDLQNREGSAGKEKPGPKPEPSTSPPKETKITYHYSCHLKRSCGVSREPRELLSALPGCSWVELEESDRCCGFAGTYSLKYPEISAELLQRKIEKIEAGGADIVAVDCPGCLLSLRGALELHKSPVRAFHSAVLLDFASGDPAGGQTFEKV